MKCTHMLRFNFIFLSILLTIVYCSSNKIGHSDWQLVAAGFEFPEGPAWDGEGSLYLSNCNSNWIARITESGVDTLIQATDTTFQKTNGLVYVPEGYILGCDFGKGQIVKISNDGSVEQFIAGFQGKPFNRPNDIIIDRNGNLYFTDPKSYNPDVLDGRLFYYNSHDFELTLVADSLAFPNGLEISPLDGRLYVCESALHKIVSYEINADGMLTDKLDFIELPGGDPDGIEFDVNGNLYVAHFGGKAIYIISPKGNIIEHIATPGMKPSNLEFAEADMKMLYITEDETNSLYRMKTTVPGHSWY